MKYNAQIDQYVLDHTQEAFELLVRLAQIPAPSHHEEQRAVFCKEWLQSQGAEGVYIDEALNVVYPIGVTEDNPVMVFMAHTDVVFPDTTPLPLSIADGNIYCPGVGDDTANVVALMTVAKYIAQNKLHPDGYGVLLVCNSCEEGLGNLKGSRLIMEKFGDRVKEFITFDGDYLSITTKAVGSKRYCVEVTTEGGHSYGAFGNRNAIAYLASLISSLYDMKVPTRGRTTYNVGTISGGTSVNTIAQQAEMLYEFRSDNREDLAEMEAHFLSAIEYYKAKGIHINVTLVGDRPCSGDVDQDRHNELIQRAISSIQAHYDHTATLSTGSTDCNIPLSMGVPAIRIGCCRCFKIHTREEYLSIDSLCPGIKLAFDMILHHF